MQQKINLTRVICLRMEKTIKAKPHRVNLRSPLPRIHYYQNKRLQVNEIPVPNTNLQLNPLPQYLIGLVFVAAISLFNARISVRD